MRYVLDTNVVSELRKRAGDPGVNDWAARQAATDLAISVVTVLEIETGILRVAHRDPAQAARLSAWFETKVLRGFAGRILPIDLPTVRMTASLHVPDPASSHDALIAATARARGLTVVTRNVGDFARADIEVFNPWSV